MTEDTSKCESPLASAAERLRRELDRWVEVAYQQGGRALDAVGLRDTGNWNPAADIVETPNEVLVFLDIPGADPAGVQVNLAGNMLTVSGERPDLKLEADHKVHIHQRARGKFCRSIPLPVPVNADAVSAEAQDGELRIRLGKSEQAKAKQIQVSVGRPAGQAPAE